MRLIDADALEKEIKEKDIMGGLNYRWYIQNAPTVDVLEQIRDEIQKEKEAIHFDISEQKAKWTNSGIYDGLTWAQEIIDKYTKGE